MSKLSPARALALDILSYARKNDSYAKEVLHASEKYTSLSPEDRSFASKLVFGVSSSYGVLDECINFYLSKPTKLAPSVRDALRISTFELLYLEKSPHAAVSQGVELVRSVAHRASGLANAVLRKIADNKDSFLYSGKDQTEILAKQSGFNYKFAKLIVDSIGEDACSDLMRAQTEPAPVYVYLLDDKKVEIDQNNLEPIAGLERSYKVLNASDFTQNFDESYAVVMDASAQYVSRIALGAGRGNMLEVGSGRGTKSSLFASIIKDRQLDLDLVCLEQFAYKNEIAKKRIAPLTDKLPNFISADATQDLSSVLSPDFDTVFIDAPCSGSGTLRRHPELVWSTNKEKLASLQALQFKILSNCSQYVKAGGELIYATCSVLQAENEELIEKFLASKAGQDFELESVLEREGLEEAFLDEFSKHTQGSYFKHQVKKGGPDGHFCARLIKKR